MQIIRFTHKKSDSQYGWINENYVGLLSSPPFGAFRRLEASIPLEEIRLLPPVQPSKIIAIGRNYPEHAKEHEVEIPEVPMIFLKPPSAIIGPGSTIILPPQSTQVEHESELGVVIARRGRWIKQEDVKNYILGYTIINDVTARDLQRRDGQWSRAKGFDTFCPTGPWIETDLDPSDILITCRVNGEIRQLSSTREMVFSIKQLIVYISSVMTLEPGDLILTGTPAGVGRLVDGDKVEIEIEGIGILRNQVKEEKK
ncbi:MAG: fumarylacetoacetate hydrolase family protein [Pelolinea sp.]|nr:fumarylacetoacetate hydrolase family protein [Pelolinea sp.]